MGFLWISGCCWLEHGWIMTFHIFRRIIPTDELIFFRGIETTNQILLAKNMDFLSEKSRIWSVKSVALSRDCFDGLCQRKPWILPWVFPWGWWSTSGFFSIWDTSKTWFRNIYIYMYKYTYMYICIILMCIYPYTYIEVYIHSCFFPSFQMIGNPSHDKSMDGPRPPRMVDVSSDPSNY